MRRTLLMSAAALGLAFAAPAFAQQTPLAAPATPDMGATGTDMSTGASTGTSGMQGHRWMGHRHAGQAAMRGQATGQPSDLTAEGARPGHEPGVGLSEPMSNQASNIDRADTRSDIAPRLPAPPLGPNASPQDFLAAAQRSLAAHRTGEAQEALERAETRLLDRSTDPTLANKPDDAPAIRQIGEARRALASRNWAAAQQAIASAMNDLGGPGATVSGR